MRSDEEVVASLVNSLQRLLPRLRSLLLLALAMILLVTEEVHKWWIRRAHATSGSGPTALQLGADGDSRQQDLMRR